MAIELKVGRCYRAKKPRPAGMFTSFVNDRQILHIGLDSVQYDGPAVADGRRYPSVKKAEVADVVHMILTTKEDLASDPYPSPDGLSGEYAEHKLEFWLEELQQQPAEQTE